MATATKPPLKKAPKFKDTAPIEVKFSLERETKNTYRFAEDFEGETPVIGTLYVQKSAFSGSAPSDITVLISIP